MTRRLSIPLGLLCGYGVAFAWAGLGTSLIAFDDHPGQLYRAWHVLGHGPAPWAWNPGWWMGYPELQFYPPGLSYAVASLHVVSFGRLTVAASYQAFAWLAYLAPGLTAWLVLRRALGDGWLALPGAFVALTLSAGITSGVEGGVATGMLPARLGWALLPLLVLSRGTVALLAAVTLVHPAHVPAAVVLVVLVAWLDGRRVGRAVVALALAAGLTAFWTLPLAAHLDETRALAWGALSLREVARHPLAWLLWLLALLGLANHARSRERASAISVALTVLPWAMLAVVLLDLALEALGVYWLPAHRVADSAWLAFVLSAGAAAGRLLGALTVEASARRATLALGAVGLAIALSLSAGTLTLWPRGAMWQDFETIARGVRLPALWTALADVPSGRVLFVRSGVPLVYGTDWWRPHSHVTALTPLGAGHPIVNGTFTHPSPVAAFVYRGDAGRGAIRELVERLDGRRLFGRDLADLDADTFNRHAERLGVSAVVALDEDVPRLGALRGNALFAEPRLSPPFVIYRRHFPVEWPRQVAPGRLHLTARPVPDGWLSARIAYYPLWRASSEGRGLRIRRGPLGDLEVESPRDAAPVELVYAPGVAEIAGLLVSALSLVAWALLSAWRRRVRRAGRS